MTGCLSAECPVCRTMTFLPYGLGLLLGAGKEKESRRRRGDYDGGQHEQRGALHEQSMLSVGTAVKPVRRLVGLGAAAC